MIRDMADSRQKGAQFERAIVRQLNEFFEDNGLAHVKCQRNLDQYQTANQCDIEIPGHSVECKAYKSGWWFAPAWWEQVCQSVDCETPVLVWKFNNKPVRVTVPLHYMNENFPVDNSHTCVVTFDTWLDILKTKIEIFNEVA
tara:strand:+ start:533 stop:958 length:426 start_codon:yes stop_codon:yes gene_type:complete